MLALPEEQPRLRPHRAAEAKKLDAKGMVKYGEGFFKSLGFAPLPETFWERSLFVKPSDRDVVCHASAWDIDNSRRSPHQDVHPDSRTKISSPSITSWATISTSAPTTDSPSCSENGANDGFHEAIGDSIALAITPEYLQKIGLLDKVPDASNDIRTC